MKKDDYLYPYKLMIYILRIVGIRHPWIVLAIVWPILKTRPIGIEEPRVRPYQQGALDGLCGVYSVVNALGYLCGPLSQARSQALFQALLAHLAQRRPLTQCMAHGVRVGEIGGMLGRVVALEYPVRRRMPFRRNPLVPLDDYWTALQGFLDSDRRIVLTALSGTYDHWTLIRRVTDRSLLLFDSDNLNRLPRDHCLMAHAQADTARHALHPTHTYFLWVD